MQLKSLNYMKYSSGCGQLYKMPRKTSELGNLTKPGYSVTHGIEIGSSSFS
jgi:hypothetical protein